MKRIRVPEDLLRAAGEASGWIPWQEVDRLPKIVEAVLRHISEHPQVPTDEQLYSMSLNLPVDMCGIVWAERDRALLAEWQRRCFVQEEPEMKDFPEMYLYEGRRSDLHADEVNNRMRLVWDHARKLGCEKSKFKEPEIPEEIEDLLYPKDDITGTHLLTGMTDRFRGLLVEAYRRGLRKGEQK